MRYQRPKGTADILPGDSEKWQYVEATARAVFKTYQLKKFAHQCLKTLKSSHVQLATHQIS